MHRRACFGVVSVLIAALTQAHASVPLTPQDALEEVSGVVDASFQDVSHLPPEEVARRLMTDNRVVLLDVRSAEEFAISHIPGAIRVDPLAKNTIGIIAVVGSLEGKVVVAYCSIGLRSSRLLVRIGQALKDKGATGLHNMRGGVFQWRNEKRPLIVNSVPTLRIHPYSMGWRQYLADDP